MPLPGGGPTAATGLLENYLGSLYLAGDQNCDSYDVGLSLGPQTTILGINEVPTIDRKPSEDQNLYSEKKK